jgi:hypothetical protein
MISSVSSMNSVSVLTGLSTNSSTGATAEQEEKKKRAYIPSVEVSAAQSQAFSPRVGDFLTNQSGKSTDDISSSSDAISATGPSGVPPSGPPPGGPPPGPPPDGAKGGGQESKGGANQAESLLSLLASTSSSISSSSVSAASSTSGESASETENDGDSDDYGAANSNTPVSQQGVNTRYAGGQQGNDGVVPVRFDETGAYQFAASQ